MQNLFKPVRISIRNLGQEGDLSVPINVEKLGESARNLSTSAKRLLNPENNSNDFLAFSLNFTSERKLSLAPRKSSSRDNQLTCKKMPFLSVRDSDKESSKGSINSSQCQDKLMLRITDVKKEEKDELMDSSS
jgi:hypothetical protein